MTTQQSTHRVNVRCDRDEVTITLDGELGRDAAEFLGEATQAALETEGVRRVSVDLRRVKDATTDGFRALTRYAARYPRVKFRFGADTERPNGWISDLGG